ncbi:MAG: DUF1015 family protein [Thiohalocapsa sp.]|jgi:uncharacterized protein (DUF1015 family)
MSLIRPFAALRPSPGHAGDVAAPPYDVVSADEARRMVAGRPWSFLHVSRAEVDLPPDTDPYAPVVYAKARENLDRMLAAGILVRDPSPCLSVYRLTQSGHAQTGLVAAASVAAYDQGRIKRHELTRPAKEDDRVRQIEALNAQTGPVFLAYRAAQSIDGLLSRASEAAPDVSVSADDGVLHELWTVRDGPTLAELVSRFDALDALYIADGHHRCAAAARIAAARRPTRPDPEAAHQHFLAVIFPHDQLRILPYNRVVRDLNGLSASAFLARLGEAFVVEQAADPVQPAEPAQFGLYLDGRWHRLRLDPALIPSDDPVARLDVSLLQDHLIGPLLGITDPRRDERIDFVGGIRGLGGLAARVDSGEMRVALSLHATAMDELIAVADAGEIMPPKSTWFEPKLADGLVSHVLD